MLTFQQYRSDVLKQALVCGVDNVISRDELASDRVLAAAAIVAAEQGVKWCREDLERFIEWTIGRLGFWVSFVLFFVGGTGLFWVLARILLPVIVDWLDEQEEFGVCGASAADPGLAALAAEATAFLEANRE